MEQIGGEGKKIAVLLGLKNTELLQKIQEISIIDIKGQIQSREEILAYVKEGTGWSIVVTETALEGELSWLELIRKIPVKYRILTFDTERLNQLLYGEMERLGVEFLEQDAEKDQILQIIERLQIMVEEIANMDAALEEEKENGHIPIQSDPPEKQEEEGEKNKGPKKLGSKLAKLREAFQGKDKQSPQQSSEKPQRERAEIEKIRKKLAEEMRLRKELEKQSALAEKKLKELEKEKEKEETPDDLKDEYIYKINKGLKRIVAVFSAAPTGKSYVMNNLAHTVARRNIKTALVDGDLKNRSLYYYCFIRDEKKREGLKAILEEDALGDIYEYGQDFLDGLLITFTCRKYDDEFYPIPIERNKARLLSLIDQLRRERDVVFVDTGAIEEDGLVKDILMMADTVLLVQNLDYRMMDENKAALKQLTKMNVPTEKMILVLNQYVENKEFDIDKVASFLGGPFAGKLTVPMDPVMAVKNIRYGQSAVARGECEEATKEAFEELAAFCFGMKKKARQPKGFAGIKIRSIFSLGKGVRE
ncbi:AAA family ATPase [Geosporobacter ferrireducens]|uniref:CobQ/CobB/MinD/ParA nucleotide binding domain-containing protein n=1 Tax=Geosporobacter ferrireducens TaxID=1424294 RepID=A0A1D8GBS6_9FIRM|nr:hypothetical protein [Geosporobacter ferrireducens]AOT68356.1 hypothetical protein Gferi_01350 [Geosporobacter ferrireducens]